jgi:hypothetical protein
VLPVAGQGQQPESYLDGYGYSYGGPPSKTLPSQQDIWTRGTIQGAWTESGGRRYVNRRDGASISRCIDKVVTDISPGNAGAQDSLLLLLLLTLQVKKCGRIVGCLCRNKGACSGMLSVARPRNEMMERHKYF